MTLWKWESFYHHIEDGKKFHPVQKEEKKLVKLESSVNESRNADWRRGIKGYKEKKNLEELKNPNLIEACHRFG